MYWTTLCHELCNKCLTVTEMDDHMATTDMGRKLGAVHPPPLFFGGGGVELGPYLTQSDLGRGLSLTLSMLSA